jgi:hypothetical protein
MLDICFYYVKTGKIPMHHGESCTISANADHDILVRRISVPAAGALSSARQSAKAYLVSQRYSRISASRAEFCDDGVETAFCTTNIHTSGKQTKAIGCHAGISSEHQHQVYTINESPVAATVGVYMCYHFCKSAFEFLSDSLVLLPQYVPIEPSVAPNIARRCGRLGDTTLNDKVD